MPRGAVNYQVFIGSTDPSRNTANEGPRTLTTLASTDITPPVPPSGLTLQPGNNAIHLSWDENKEVDFGS